MKQTMTEKRSGRIKAAKARHRLANGHWSVWWDFTHDNPDGMHVIVQSNHPDYDHVYAVYDFPVDSIAKNGYIDSWIEEWFNPFQADVESGRIVWHDLMRELGHSPQR